MLVKKYTNRRLYDTAESRYITLEELAEKVRDGHDPVVVDAKTGEDLTQATLTQIIMESRGAAKILPIPLLLQLIRLGDSALSEFLGTYLSQALEAYLSLKRGANAIAPLNPFANLPFAATTALARLLMGGGMGDMGPSGWNGSGPNASQAAQSAPGATKTARETPDSKTNENHRKGSKSENEMATLRRELEELKREVHRKKK